MTCQTLCSMSPSTIKSRIECYMCNIKNLNDIKVNAQNADAIKGIEDQKVALLNRINSEIDYLNDKTSEVANLQNQASQLEQENAVNSRMVDIGRYEQRRYSVRFDLLKYIGMGIIALFLVQIAKRYFLPQSAATALTVGISVLIVIKIMYSVYDMYIRDSLYYDKYRHYTNKELLQKGGDLGQSEHYQKLLEDSQCSTGIIGIDDILGSVQNPMDSSSPDTNADGLGTQ